MEKKKKFTTGSKVRYGIALADQRHMKYIRARLMIKQKRMCALCGKPIENDIDATLDHIIPRSAGGATTEDNLQLAHKECNAKKGCNFTI